MARTKAQAETVAVSVPKRSGEYRVVIDHKEHSILVADGVAQVDPAHVARFLYAVEGSRRVE